MRSAARCSRRRRSARAIVVLRSVDGRLRGFSVRDGSTIWTVEQELPSLTVRGNTAPRLAGNVVVAGFNNGRVGAYDVASGDAAWEVAVANPTGRTELDRLVDVSASIQVVATEAYVVGYHGRAVGIDIGTGVVLWQQDMSSFAGLSADFTTVYVTTDVDSVIALDRRAGAQVWRQDGLRLRDVTAPARFGNTIAVGDFEGYLHFLDTGDGHFVAREHAAKGRIVGGAARRRREHRRARRRRHARGVHRARREEIAARAARRCFPQWRSSAVRTSASPRCSIGSRERATRSSPTSRDSRAIGATASASATRGASS